MKALKVLSLTIVIALATLLAWDYLYHPTITLSDQLTAAEIEQLKSDLHERGVSLEIENLEYNANGEISEIKGAVQYSQLTSGSFETDDFSGIKVNGGLLYMDINVY